MGGKTHATYLAELDHEVIGKAVNIARLCPNAKVMDMYGGRFVEKEIAAWIKKNGL